MKKHIPNLLTCCNLLCGCLGILNLFDADSTPFSIPASPLMSTAYFIWAACIFDFLDGFAARVLHVTSPIGKQLDSLADLVSFGLLPGFFMYRFIGNIQPEALGYSQYLPLVALFMIVCSALRLAVFNVDENQKDSFRGLPTPANALFITALPFFTLISGRYLFIPEVLALITLVFSLLLVSRIELFALKFKTFSWSENNLRFTFLLLSVLLLAILQAGAIPLIIIFYIILSLARKAFSR